MVFKGSNNSLYNETVERKPFVEVPDIFFPFEVMYVVKVLWSAN